MNNMANERTIEEDLALVINNAFIAGRTAAMADQAISRNPYYQREGEIWHVANQDALYRAWREGFASAALCFGVDEHRSRCAAANLKTLKTLAQAAEDRRAASIDRNVRLAALAEAQRLYAQIAIAEGNSGEAEIHTYNANRAERLVADAR